MDTTKLSAFAAQTLPALHRATLQAIRTAAMHGTELVTYEGEKMIIIKPQDHPLYAQAFADTHWVPRSELSPATAKLKQATLENL
jgi:hypothetical protein